MAKYVLSHLKTAIDQGWIDTKMVEKSTEKWKMWGNHPASSSRKIVR